MQIDGFFLKRLLNATGCLAWANSMDHEPRIRELATHHMANAVPELKANDTSYRAAGAELARKPYSLFNSMEFMSGKNIENAEVQQNLIQQALNIIGIARATVEKTKEKFQFIQPFNNTLIGIDRKLHEIIIGYDEAKKA